MKIRIDPEFAALIPAVLAEHVDELEREVVRDKKILNALVVWQRGPKDFVLLDGHRRYRLMLRHPELKAPQPIVMDLESRQEAHDWIIRHQLSKRNVSDAQRQYLLGKLYIDQKLPVGRPEILSTKHMAAAATLNSGSTAEKIAKENDVSARTVRANAAFAEAVDAIAEVNPDAKAAILSGEVKVSQSAVTAVAELPKRERMKAAAQIAAGEKPKLNHAPAKPKPFDEQAGTEHAKRLRWWIDERGSKFGKGEFHRTAIAEFNGLMKTIDDWQAETGGKVERARR